MMKLFLLSFVLLFGIGLAQLSHSAELNVGDDAPPFQAKLHDGSDFDLLKQKGKSWTVLYFYPKADTPGCTKQACAFRDSLDSIRKLNAQIFGVSTDSVEAQNKFHQKYNLNFPLIADEKGDIVALYGSKMPLLNVSKRWTYVIDPELKIRWIDKNVDPVQDAERVAEKIKMFQEENE